MSGSPHAEAAPEGPVRSGMSEYDGAVEHPGAPERSDGAAQTTAPAGDALTAADSTPASVDPRVDDALSRLAELDALPLSEQVEVYTDIHRRLSGVLADPGSQA